MIARLDGVRVLFVAADALRFEPAFVLEAAGPPGGPAAASGPGAG